VRSRENRETLIVICLNWQMSWRTQNSPAGRTACLDLGNTLPWKTSALIFARSGAIIQISVLMKPSTLLQIKESGSH
jgi:hypothetical protein